MITTTPTIPRTAGESPEPARAQNDGGDDQREPTATASATSRAVRPGQLMTRS